MASLPQGQLCSCDQEYWKSCFIVHGKSMHEEFIQYSVSCMDCANAQRWGTTCSCTSAQCTGSWTVEWKRDQRVTLIPYSYMNEITTVPSTIWTTFDSRWNPCLSKHFWIQVFLFNLHFLHLIKECNLFEVLLYSMDSAGFLCLILHISEFTDIFLLQ